MGYFREVKGESGSLADQSRLFLEFCRRNGYEAAAAFLDGPPQDGDLVGYRQMVEFLKQQAQRGFMVVAVPGLGGLGDELVEAARRYFQLSSLGVRVLSMEANCDVGGTLLQAWAGEGKDQRLGERVKAAMRKKAVKGEALGRPPYGYKVGARRRLQIVAEEGAIVRFIFRLYLKDGLGIRRIARRLNEEGFKTRRGGLWSMVTVRDILRNRAYVGTYSRFGVRVPASHPPLISVDDFRRVQERMDQRRPATQARVSTPFLLSGLIYCDYCSNKMIGVTRKQRWQRRGDGTVRRAQYRYYQCESRTNRSLCDYHTHRADELEANVREAILRGDNVRPAVAVAGDEAAVVAEGEAKARRLRDKLRRLDRRLQQYLDTASQGRIGEERLRVLSLAVAEEQLHVEEALVESQRLAQRQASIAERRCQQQEALVRLRDEWDRLTVPDRQDLLRGLLDRVNVRDDGMEVLLRA
ncbi:MAG: recombinase family protein [Chloroflexi bacterium]|nr:recombinase family protein [Chloroflexota bacterium]